MKLIYLFSICSYFLISGNCEEEKTKAKNDLTLSAVVKGIYNLPEHTGKDSIFYILVTVKLTNNTNSNIEFLAYSCAVGKNIVIDTKNIETCANNCGGNFLSSINLNKKQSFNLPVILKMTRENFNRQIKIGWILLTKENTGSVDNHFSIFEKNRANLENVIWSDPVLIPSSGGQPYVIE